MINIFSNSKDIEIYNSSNIYLITGLSGSGKSFYCKDVIAKNPNAIVIQLDWLKHPKHATAYGKKLNDEFSKKYPDVLKYMSNKFYNVDETKDSIYKDYINKYFDFILSRTNKSEIYVIEGIQIFSLINYNEKMSKEFNIYIKGTSSVNSLKNRIQRDYDDEEKISLKTKLKFLKRVVKESFIFQFHHRKLLNDYIKFLIK